MSDPFAIQNDIPLPEMNAARLREYWRDCEARFRKLWPHADEKAWSDPALRELTEMVKGDQK